MIRLCLDSELTLVPDGEWDMGLMIQYDVCFPLLVDGYQLVSPHDRPYTIESR